MERRTYWLSFNDSDRPVGQRFLGVCLVDVDQDEAEEAAAAIAARFPRAINDPDAKWIGAAIRMSHAMGCNPGGDVVSLSIPPDAPGQRNRLLQRGAVEALDEEIRQWMTAKK